jgi:hypothetical protein
MVLEALRSYRRIGIGFCRRLPCGAWAIVGVLELMRPAPGLHISQREFADRYGVPEATLQDWEQHRRKPDAATRSYLQIARSPDMVRRSLACDREHEPV